MWERGKTAKLIVVVFLVLGLGIPSHAAMEEQARGGHGFGKPAVTPNSQIRVHDVGKLWMTISNYATFANPHDLPDPRNPDALAPSCMYPGGSNLEYLFAGFLWIGAEKDSVYGGNTLDTLVSAGGDGWLSIDSELWPDFPPRGEIEVRSTRPSDVYPYGDTTDAISEQDYIAVFNDLKTDASYVPTDPYDQKPHRPLGIEVTQKSYAWSYEYAEDFVLFDYDIKNVSDHDLQNVWLGLYIDADVWHTSENPYGQEQGAQDDICGFVDSVVTAIVGGDTTKTGIFTAYIADNDGQVYDGAFEYRSPRGVSGVRVVRSPNPSLQYGFNWWISNTDANLDWGPMKLANLNLLPDGRFPSGGLGTPGPDWSKYFVMSNGEFDYDQIWTNQDWTGDGWMQSPDPVRAADLANGYDTRYLFSFGPFPSINSGETLKLTTAYICGENLHVDPSNYVDNLRDFTDDAGAVQTFYDNLDFRDFATNSQWADWVYDNPGVDTQEPYTDENEDGQYTPGEPFRDYDGNGVWTGPDGNRGLYQLVGDSLNPDTFWYKGDGVPDFAGPPPPPSPRLTFNTSPGVVNLTWNGETTETAEDNFSHEVDFEGYRIYMSRTGRLGEYTLLGDFDVIDYDSTYIDSTVSPPVWKLWKEPPRRLDRFVDFGYNSDFNPDTSQYWVPYGWNSGLGSLTVGDTTYSYSYTISGLSESVGMYFAVTAYDFGNPVTNLSSLESSQTINAKYVYAIAKGAQAGKVAVYPNPYKITGNYAELGYEDRDRSGWTEFDRRIMFSGLPSTCTIRIFTLDGDLVRQIEHDDATSPEGPGVNYWDLISRNTQGVVSGVYIYSIEGEGGFHQLGKIAIIK